MVFTQQKKYIYSNNIYTGIKTLGGYTAWDEYVLT
jgi:hypothetical protein